MLEQGIIFVMVMASLAYWVMKGTKKKSKKGSLGCSCQSQNCGLCPLADKKVTQSSEPLKHSVPTKKN